MNLDSLSFTLSQISYLVASLSKKKYSQVIEDLTKVSWESFYLQYKKNFRKFRMSKWKWNIRHICIFVTNLNRKNKIRIHLILIENEQNLFHDLTSDGLLSTLIAAVKCRCVEIKCYVSFFTAGFFAWSGGGPSLASMSVFLSRLFWLHTKGSSSFSTKSSFTWTVC